VEGLGLNVGRCEPQGLQGLINTVQDGLARLKGDYAYDHSAEISRDGVDLAPVKAHKGSRKSSDTFRGRATGWFFSGLGSGAILNGHVNLKSCRCSSKLVYSHECNCRP
jgi:hypothetical protein